VGEGESASALPTEESSCHIFSSLTEGEGESYIYRRAAMSIVSKGWLTFTPLSTYNVMYM
jgi:hypothetical protein